jgi:hypothetical protein
VSDKGRLYNPAGGETLSAMRERLIKEFPGGNFDAVRLAAEQKYGAKLKTVVPVEGVHPLMEGGKPVTFADVMSGPQANELQDLLKKAFVSLGEKDDAALKKAKKNRKGLESRGHHHRPGHSHRTGGDELRWQLPGRRPPLQGQLN